MRRTIRSLLIPATAVLLVGGTACDPCAGTSSCRTGARLSYTGHLVERSTGRSVSGGQVSFIRIAGVALARDTVAATTGDDGFFTIAADAAESGVVRGRLHVSPPGKPAYDTDTLELRTSTINGDGGDLGRIVTDPYLSYIAQIRLRGSGDNTGGYATVKFRRTGGIEIEPQEITTAADLYGRFVLTPTPKQAGILEGEITVYPYELNQRAFTTPIRLTTRYQDVAVHDVAVVNVGIALPWVGEAFRRGTTAHQAGIQVDFERTGGINVTPARFTGTTDAVGYFPIQPTPATDGEVVGNVIIHPPNGAPVTYTGVRVHTTSDDTVRFAGRFGYGAQAFGLAELRYHTTMQPIAPGTVVRFHRTGGVPALSDFSVDTVKSLGFAHIGLPTDATGEITGDLEVALGEPYGTQILTGVRVRSTEDDTLRFVGTYLVGRWFPQVGQVVDSATQRPIPGARVTFTRTSGIAIQPTPYVTTPGPDGYFNLRPQPLTDGEVVGTLTFELPAPYPPTVSVPNVRLTTSTRDAVQFIGAWFIAPRS